MKKALIVVDVQRDFCDGGVLPAKDTSNLISPLNAVIASCIPQRRFVRFYARLASARSLLRFIF